MRVVSHAFVRRANANGTGISSATHPEWRDPHKGLWLAGLVIPLTPFIAWGLVSLLGPGVFWLAGLLTIAVVPSLDRFYGPDRSNPPDEIMKRLENSRYYRWCLVPHSTPVRGAGPGLLPVDQRTDGRTRTHCAGHHGRRCRRTGDQRRP